MKAYSYIRMSTPEQLKGDSRRRQLEASERYAQQHNLELEPLIIDAGMSAYRGDNAEFGALSKFRDMVQKQEIDRGSVLVIESLDRLSRQNVMSAFPILTEIVNSGITVVTLIDGQTYSADSIENNPAIMLFAIMTMLRAHEESKTKSDRLAAAWGEKRKRARSGIPSKQRIPSWLEFTPDGTFVVNRSRAVILKEIFDLSRDGWGAYSIARKLTARGEQTWGRGKVWQESFIKKIISNRAVLGEYQPHRKFHDGAKMVRQPEGEPIKDYYPKVIAVVDFEAAKLAIGARRNKGRGRKGLLFRNVFTGLLKCGSCGAGMRFVDKGRPPKGGTYLRCSQSLLKGDCIAPAWRYSNIEETLLSHIEGADYGVICGRPSRHTKLIELATEVATLSADEVAIQGKINTIIAAIEEAKGSSNSLLQRLSELDIAKASTGKALAEARLAHSEAATVDPEQKKQLIVELVEALGSVEMIDGEMDVRRRLWSALQSIISRIDITPYIWEAHEIVEDHPAAYQKILDSGIPLLDVMRLYGFRVEVHYRSGDVAQIMPITDNRLNLSFGRKFAYWKSKRELLEQ